MEDRTTRILLTGPEPRPRTSKLEGAGHRISPSQTHSALFHLILEFSRQGHLKKCDCAKTRILVECHL